MEKQRDKLRSIGCLLAGIGMFLLGASAAALVVAMFTVDIGKLTGLQGLDQPVCAAGQPSATNVVSVILALATNVAAAADNGGDPLGNLSDANLENIQKQLLDQLSDPAKMAGGMGGLLSDTNTQKQVFDILNSDYFREQMRELFDGQSMPFPAFPPPATATNR